MNLRPLAKVLPALAATAVVLAACRGEPVAQDSELALGGQAYLAHCSVCHGIEGQGDGPLAASIVAEHRPEPAKFTAEKIRTLGRGGVRRALGATSHRQARAPMPIWGPHLGREWTDRITNYVLHMPAMDAAARTAVARYVAPVGATGGGRRTYVTYCSSCHGPQGGGDPFFTPVLGMTPSSLETGTLSEMDDAQLTTFLAPGGPHMDLAPNVPGWLYTITPDQRAELVAYLRTLRPEAGRY